MPALKDRVVDALNAQLGRELEASNEYLSMAIWFDDRNLEELAAFFYDQSLEEREHAMKFVHYLLDAGSTPVIPSLSKPTADFDTAEEVAATALEQEEQVTECIHELVDLALENGDHTTNHFLQWFVEEQLEEEDTFQKLLDVIQEADNLILVEEYVHRQAEPAQ